MNVAGGPAGAAFYAGAAVAVVLLAATGAGLGRTIPGRRLLRALHGVEAGLVALLLAAMLLLSCLQIVLRNLAHTGFVWIDPLLRHMLLWIGLLAGLLATRLERHIAIDVLSRFQPPRAVRASRVATSLFAAATCVAVASACWQVVRDEAAAGTTGFLGLPAWTLQAILPVAFLGMAARFVSHTWTPAPPPMLPAVVPEGDPRDPAGGAPA